MTSFFSGFLATIITLPLLSFFLFFILLRSLMEQKRKAFQLSIDLTTIILIYSVYFLGQVIFNVSLLAYIFIFILIIAIIFLFLQWKVTEDIHVLKVLKGVWRCNFLFFLIFYFSLTIYGLSQRIGDL